MTGAIRLSFGIDTRARFRRQPLAPNRADVAAIRRDACASCEWFQASVVRCCFPRFVCPRSPARIEPWHQLAACPANKWPGVQFTAQ